MFYKGLIYLPDIISFKAIFVFIISKLMYILSIRKNRKRLNTFPFYIDKPSITLQLNKNYIRSGLFVNYPLGYHKLKYKRKLIDLHQQIVVVKTRMTTSIGSKAFCSITDRQTEKIFIE